MTSLEIQINRLWICFSFSLSLSLSLFTFISFYFFLLWSLFLALPHYCFHKWWQSHFFCIISRLNLKHVFHPEALIENFLCVILLQVILCFVLFWVWFGFFFARLFFAWIFIPVSVYLSIYLLFPTKCTVFIRVGL